MDFESKLGLSGCGMVIVIASLVIGSWIVNINKLIDCDFEAPYKCEVVHAIGIIPVAGIVTAWMNPDGEPVKADEG